MDFFTVNDETNHKKDVRLQKIPETILTSSMIVATTAVHTLPYMAVGQCRQFGKTCGSYWTIILCHLGPTNYYSLVAQSIMG